MKYAVLFTVVCIILFSCSTILLAQPALRPGWPHDYGVPGVSSQLNRSSVTLYSYSNGGRIIATAGRDSVRIFDIDGTVLHRWGVAASFPQTPLINSGPNLADLDGDNEPEVILTLRNESALERTVAGFSLSGQLLETIFFTYSMAEADSSLPVILELSGDDQPEILFTASDTLFAYHPDGTIMEGFPYWLSGQSVNSSNGPVVYQIPLQEVVFFWTTSNNLLHAKILDHDGELQGFPVNFDPATTFAGPVVIPVEGGWWVSLVSNEEVYLWDADGNILTGFPQSLTGENISDVYHLAASDLDGDASPELTFRTNNNDIHAIDLTGNYLPDYPIEAGDNSAGESIAVIKESLVSNGIAVLGTRSNTATSGLLQALQNGSSVEGFPVEIETTEEWANFSTALFLPENDCLSIVIHSTGGYTAVYDLPFEITDPYLEWGMPGNTPQGNRMYQPQQIAPDVPSLTFAPDEVDFGILYDGDFGQIPIQVTNSGNAEGFITGFFPSEGLEGQLGIWDELPVSIPAGETNEFMLIWFPFRNGLMNGEFYIQHNDPAQQFISAITVMGEYRIPVLEWSSVDIDFGELETDEIGEQALVIRNTGSIQAVLDSFRVEETDPEDFYFDPNLPIEIPAGDSAEVTLYWQPDETDVLDTQLTVYHNAPGSDYFTHLYVSGMYTNSSEETSSIPKQYAFSANYPNPFNNSTRFSLDLPEASLVTLSIYDLTGRKVRPSTIRQYAAGTYSIDINLQSAASGIYFVSLSTEHFSSTRKILLIK